MNDATLAELVAAIDAPGFILDLRGNSGGNEMRARAENRRDRKHGPRRK
jgi:C-terminal processing protease CtpA/Prc